MACCLIWYGIIGAYARSGNQYKQAQRARNVQHIDQAIGVGVVGAMAIGTTNTAAVGALVAKGAAAAGLTSLTALGSLPVAGGLLLGGGALVAGAVATVVAGKAIYKGVKAFSSLFKGNQNSSFPVPKRSVNSGNMFREAQKKVNKVDGYIKSAKKDFIDKKDISNQTKDLANLRGLNSKQKKEVGNLYADNQIRNSAQANGGVVNEFNIKKQVLADAKEQGWSSSKTKQMLASTKNRVEVQKKNQNITQKGKVLSVEKADLKVKAQKAPAKAATNVQKQTASVGKSVMKSANNVIQKAPAKQVQAPQKSASSSNDYHNASRGR